jgi:hypothetical protein
MRRVRLDEQTVILLGGTEFEVNDGITPNRILSSGVIKDTIDYDPIFYTVISDIIDLTKEDNEESIWENISKNSA